MPLMSGTQLSPPHQSHSLGGHQRPSLANRFCPFCKSQKLQYTSSAPVFNPLTPLSTSASPRVAASSGHTASRDGTGSAATTTTVSSGFVVSGDAKTANNPEPVPDSRKHGMKFSNEEAGIGGWDTLEDAQSYDAVPGQGTQDSIQDNTKNTAPLTERNQYSTSSWSFGELSGNQAPQNLRSSHDVLYHPETREQQTTARQDTRDTEDSSTSYTQDSGGGDSRRDTRDALDSRFNTQNTTKHKYKTIHGGDVRSCEVSDLSRSGGKSSRLTNSEPTPKLTPAVRTNEVRTQQTGGLRRFSSVEQPKSKSQNPFDDMTMLHGRSTEPVPFLSRMRLPRASLGSVQEQPSTSLNPFDESCSTNPFDGEESTTSNPFGNEDDDHMTNEVERKEGMREGEGKLDEGKREGEGELEEAGRWGQVNLKDRAHSFSRNEECYFTDFHSLYKETKKLENVPPSSHPSSSVPVTSYMTAFGSQISSGRESHNTRTRSKKSSTLPSGSRNRQNDPVPSKKSTTIPRGKPPLYRLVRGKSMESLDRISPRSEQHPTKSNRVISPFLHIKGFNPFGEGRSRVGADSSKANRKSSSPPSGGSGKWTPEMAKRGHSSSDTLSMGRGQWNIHK